VAGVVLLAAWLSAGRPARAADPRTESARQHSAQGDAYYKLEKYSNAIGEYEQAYLAKPDPSFLYNIAQCHRLMGQSAEALNFYRRFLRDAPNAPNREVAEKHIKDLEEASHASLEPPPVAAAPPVVAAPPAIAAPSAVAPPPAPEPAASAAPPPPSPSPATNPGVATGGSTLALTAPPPATAPTGEMPPLGDAGVVSSPSESHPIYNRWWFWTAIGVVVAGGLILALSAKHDPSCPGGYTCN
jgi:tetratricopeptide (TPR) repeat protein